uniref:Glycosyltransferase family 92 protein n=1 Tax=viral metagenome TaxID=1070528 RepID=A0A6C0IIZ8_9ZZZZ
MSILNSFHLNNYKYLFFDIFYKNNNIFLILPAYVEPFNPDKINIIINNTIINNKNLKLSEKHIIPNGETVAVYIYNYESNDNDIQVIVKYENIIRSFSLQNIKIERKHQLALTTLFKDDYNIFPIFYDYYIKQGVEYFYMYYNGISTPQIKQLLNLPNVSLIDWNFKYWKNDVTLEHHAQPGQIHHALYRYGKDISDYMIFCDLDEYLHIPKYTLREYIGNNKAVDSFGFCNRWSKTLDNNYIKTFPKRFLTTAKTLPYNHRSKNIHKTDSINTIGIHMAHSYTMQEPKILINFSLFHFYNWSKPKRDNKDCKMEIITL